MTLITRALLALAAFAQAACLTYPNSPTLERRTSRSFDVAPGSLVQVAVSGGTIDVVEGPAGHVEAVLVEEVFAGSEREADAILAKLDSTVAQHDDVVVVRGHRDRNDWSIFGGTHVRFSATVTVPPDVRLDVDTSGGSISVRGDRQASLDADTSGGSIRIDGGSGPMTLDTSGGSIKVGRALRQLDAETSGGSITVEYVGPDASEVRLQTSGGSITVGVDPDARLAIDAGTSGGGVHVDGLPFSNYSEERHHVRGALNGGSGGSLTAATSGGSIRIRSAHE